MAGEDLHSPLRGGPAARPRRRRTVAGLATAALALLLIPLGAWVLLTDDPLGGEPVATASIERRLAPAPGEATRAAAREEQTFRNGVPVISPGDPLPASGPVIIRVPGSAVSGASGGPGAPSADLAEPSRFGSLPRIAADGRRPSAVYARAGPSAAGKPRVAILVAGIGAVADTANGAIERLPADVSLAFDPYAAHLGRWADKARGDGHEFFLQVPLELYDRLTDGTGPQALLTSLPAAANLDRLRWTMGRTAGYVGLAGQAGAKFTASEEALAPVLTEVARRGLVFVDAASGPDSLAPRIGGAIGLAVVRGDMVVDARPEPALLDAELARLERLARDRGHALGLASPAASTVDRIAAWAEGLGRRGVVLVPVSALTAPAAAAATATP